MEEKKERKKDKKEERKREGRKKKIEIKVNSMELQILIALQQQQTRHEFLCLLFANIYFLPIQTFFLIRQKHLL